MPTYDYRCAACGHELEHFQSMREAALKKCPKCGKSKLERLIGTGAGILFKGDGFYQTDYRSESYKRGESSEKDSAKPAGEPAKAAESGAAKAESSKERSKESSKEPSKEPPKEKGETPSAGKSSSKEPGKPAKKKPA